MKTKEQILAWLDEQPWKDEFYKAIFLYGNPKRVYNVNFLISAFHWGETIQGETIWSKRNKEYQKWYNSTSTDKPHSWEELCETEDKMSSAVKTIGVLNMVKSVRCLTKDFIQQNKKETQ